jgi:hypothetical protein
MAELTATKKNRLDQWVDSLPEDDRAALIDAAADSRFSNAGLLRVIQAHGYSSSKDTLADWRRRHGLTS